MHAYYRGAQALFYFAGVWLKVQRLGVGVRFVGVNVESKVGRCLWDSEAAVVSEIAFDLSFRGI